MSHRPAAPGPWLGSRRGSRDRAGTCFARSGYRIGRAGDQGTLFLATTDDVHGNGSWAFTWLTREYRQAPDGRRKASAGGAGLTR